MAERNEPLAAWMTAHQMAPAELADAVNDAVCDLTGRLGTASARTVHRWLSGESRWPQERQRRALQTVTGLSATALGFAPRGKSTSAPVRPEDPDMRRRRFVGVAATAAAAALPTSPASARPARVGTSDVVGPGVLSLTHGAK